jgi:FlaA1/EpsC-like NDP-sugar epimerase
MHLFRRHFLLYVFKIFDLMVMAFSFAMASWVISLQYPLIKFSRPLSIQVRLENLIFFLILLFLWHIIFGLFGLYRSMLFSSRWVEIKGVVKAASEGTMVVLTEAFLFRIKIITPMFLVVFWVASNIISLLGRFVMRHFLTQMRIYGRNLRFVLIVGTNKRVPQFAQSIESKKGTWLSNHWPCRGRLAWDKRFSRIGVSSHQQF